MSEKTCEHTDQACSCNEELMMENLDAVTGGAGQQGVGPNSLSLGTDGGGNVTVH